MDSILNRITEDPGFEGLNLDGLKALAQGVKSHLVFTLEPRDGGYALRYDLRRTFGFDASGWYLAERTKAVRRFATVEAAVNVARELGLSELRVRIAHAKPDAGGSSL